MKWVDFLHLLHGMTLFEASALLAGSDPPGEVRRQLSRWVASGRLIQLRRGLYALAPPYAGAAPNGFALASRIRLPSYVSLQSALSYHGIIPESVPVVTSVTTNRPGQFETPLGGFLYRHLKRDLFWGYREVDVDAGQKAFVAIPEKALLDHFYLTPGIIDSSFVRELRLDPEHLDFGRLRTFATRAAKPRLVRAASLTVRILEKERAGETSL
jgi:predicted transcriptional regulator of viral defense system